MGSPDLGSQQSHPLLPSWALLTPLRLEGASRDVESLGSQSGVDAVVGSEEKAIYLPSRRKAPGAILTLASGHLRSLSPGSQRAWKAD